MTGETQAAILAATIETWTGPIQEARRLGAIDRDGWDQSITFMGSLGLVEGPGHDRRLVREDLLPAGD